MGEMPKERISRNPGAIGVEVYWHKDFPSVQLGIFMNQETNDAPRGYAIVQGDGSIEKVNDAGKEGFETFPVIHTDELDRENINRLIHVLRRARDQAFGKDA